MTRPPHLSGLAELLARLQIDPQDPQLQAALAAAGEEVIGHAQSALRASGTAQAAALSGSLRLSVSSGAATIGSDHPAAFQAEFGSLDQPARPFLAPALEAARPAATRRLRTELNRLTRQAKGANR